MEEAGAPQLDIALADGGKLVIRHRALERATLRLFSVDLEVLFSKDPFLKARGTTTPNPPSGLTTCSKCRWSRRLRKPPSIFPQSLRQGNVLVSAESGNTKLLKVLDSRAMELRHLPLERTLQVLDAATGKPLVKTYIKVYAEKRNGEVVFHKDGYTDLRGKFDYLSHTGSDPSKIKRVALLVSHPEKGARTVVYDR